MTMAHQHQQQQDKRQAPQEYACSCWSAMDDAVTGAVPEHMLHDQPRSNCSSLQPEEQPSTTGHTTGAVALTSIHGFKYLALDTVHLGNDTRFMSGYQLTLGHYPQCWFAVKRKKPLFAGKPSACGLCAPI